MNDIEGGLRNVLPGNIDTWNKVYATVAEANTAIPNNIVGGKSFREGKVVQIGTSTVYEEYRWKGGFANENLLPSTGKIPTWQAQPYPANFQVTNAGKIWMSNTNTLATDIPGSSEKWDEDLTGYVSNTIRSDISSKLGRVTLAYIAGTGVITPSANAANSWSGYVDVSVYKDFEIKGNDTSFIGCYSGATTPVLVGTLPMAGIHPKAVWPVGTKYIGINISGSTGFDYSATTKLFVTEDAAFPNINPEIWKSISWDDLGESLYQTLFNTSAPTSDSTFFVRRATTSNPELRLIRFIPLDGVSYRVSIPAGSVPVTKTLFIYRKYKITSTERTVLSTHVLAAGINVIQKTGTETHFSIQPVYTHPTDPLSNANFNLITASTVEKGISVPVVTGRKAVTLINSNEKMLQEPPIVIKDGVGWSVLQGLERWNRPKGIVNSSGNLTISPTAGLELKVRCLWAVELTDDIAYKIVLPLDKFPSDTTSLRYVKKTQVGDVYTNVGAVTTITESETIIEKTGSETCYCLQIVYLSTSTPLQNFDILTDGQIFIAKKDSEGNVPTNKPYKVLVYEGNEYKLPSGDVDFSLFNKLNDKILGQQSTIDLLKYNMPLPTYRLLGDVFQTKMQGHSIYGMFDYHFGDQIIYDSEIDKSYICWFMRPERFFNNAVMTYNHATGAIDDIFEFDFDVKSYSADRDYHCRTVMTLLPDGNLIFCTERTHNGALLTHRTTVPRDITSIVPHVTLGNGAYPKFWQHSSGRMMVAFRVGNNFQYICGDFSNDTGATFTERYNIAEREIVAGMRYYSAIPIQVKGDTWHLLIMTRQDSSQHPFGYRFLKFFYLKSTDGGVNWSNIQGTFSKDVKNTSALTEAELTTNYMFEKVPDADSVSSAELGGACILPSGQPFILNGTTVAGTHGVKLSTYTGGAWVQKTLTIPNVLRYRSIYVIDANTIDVVAIVETIVGSKAYNQAIIYRSTDAGDTFVQHEVLTDNPNTPEPLGYMQITNNYDAAKKLIICNANTIPGENFSDLFIKPYNP